MGKSKLHQAALVFHSLIQIVCWSLMVSNKYWQKDRPTFIFIATFTTWMFHWLVPLFNTIEHNRKNLGYDVLATAMSLAASIVATSLIDHNENLEGQISDSKWDKLEATNISIIVFSWVSFVLFFGELVWVFRNRKRAGFDVSSHDDIRM